MFLKMRSQNGMELVLISAVDSGLNQITVTRGQDGTTPVGHAVGTEALAAIPAIAFNQMREEIQALEGALLSSGFLHDIILAAAASSAGTTFRDSPKLILRSTYWDGDSSENYDVRVYQDRFGTPVDSTQLVWDFANVNKMILSPLAGLYINQIQALTQNGLLDIVKNGTGGIRIGTTNNFSNSQDILIGRGNDSIEIGGGIMTFQLSGQNVGFALVAGNVQIRNNNVLSFYSDAGSTTQSTFTPSAGATTWLGASNSNIIIEAPANAGISIGITGGVPTPGDGEVKFGSATTTFWGSGSGHLYSVVGNVERYRFHPSSALHQFSQGNPIVFYGGTGTDERWRLQSGGANNMGILVGSAALVSITNETAVSIIGVNKIEPLTVNSNLNFRLNPLVGGTSSYTMGQISLLANTFRIGNTTQYIEIPVEAPAALSLKVVGTVSATMLEIQDATNGGIKTNNVTAITTNTALVLSPTGTGYGTLQSSDGTDYFRMNTTNGQIARNSITQIEFTDAAIRIMNGAPMILFSDNGTTEQSRFTIAAGSTTWDGASNSNIIISVDSNAGISIGNGSTPADGEVAIFASSTKGFRMGGAGGDYIFTSAFSFLDGGQANPTLVINAGSDVQVRNSFPLIIYAGNGSDERGRWDTTLLRLEAADAADNTATNSPQLILQAKNNQSGAPVQIDFDFALRHEVTAGAGTAGPTLDFTFKNSGTLGFTIRRVVGAAGEYVIPMLPNVDTTVAPAASFPGGMVYDAANGLGSKIFTSDGTTWTERL